MDAPADANPAPVSARMRADAAAILRAGLPAAGAKACLDSILAGAGLPPGAMAELIDPLGRPSRRAGAPPAERRGGGAGAGTAAAAAPAAQAARAPPAVPPPFPPIAGVENAALTKRDMVKHTLTL